MGQTGRGSIATHILAVKIVSAVALFHSFGVARQGPWVTWVNKDSSKDRSSYPYSAGRYLLHGSNTPQRCLKRSATALGERLSLGSALVDGGLCLRKPPNVRPVSAHAVGFVAAFDSTSPLGHSASPLWRPYRA